MKNNKKYVSLELALLLKEKGFDLPCEYIYANHCRVKDEILEKYPGLSDSGYKELTIECGGVLKEEEVYATYIEPIREYAQNSWVDLLGNKVCTMPTLDDAFDKVGGRSGAVFFVSGIATAVTDPTTGYYNPVRFRFVNIEDARKTVSCLDGIFYDSSRDRFRIEIDFSKFTGVLGDTRTKWTLVTNGFRWKNRKQVTGKWSSRKVGLTRAWADLLGGFEVDLYGDIRKQILERTDGKNSGVKDFLMGLMNLLQMTAQVRHVDMEHEETYICSPIENSDGVCCCDLEDGADAVAAYNIARKGLVLVNRIRSAAGNKVSLSCTYQEWLGQMQDNTDA